MSGLEVQAAGAAVLGLSLYYGLNKYTDNCRVQLITADEGVSRLIAKDSGEEASIRRLLETECPSLTDPKKAFMIPTPYLCGGMLQTVYCTTKALKRDQYSNIKYDRELHEMDDKGTISLDWYPKRSEDPADTTPIVVIMTGVGGSSYEYHIRCLAKALADGPLKYRVVVMNHRGSGRTPLTSPKLYNAYYTEDFRDIVKYIHSSYDQARLIGIGFSLGANLITKYLGEEGSKCLLSAGIAVCCPFDMSIAGRALDADGFLNNNVFQPNLVATMKRLLKRNLDVIKTSEIDYDLDKIMKVKRMSELDNLVTAKTYGFQDCWAYYDAASSTHYVDNIATPYLAINSLDDPVTPPEGIPVDKFKTNPNISLALVKHGGHLGFFTGLSPTIWYLDPIVEFIGAIVDNSKLH
ncbi:AB-hydrolase YheT [Martensiomyces pterosporus]|nr:AB-hydrolase YheT [Martensiomyces pterosporus]